MCILTTSAVMQKLHQQEVQQLKGNIKHVQARLDEQILATKAAQFKFAEIQATMNEQEVRASHAIQHGSSIQCFVCLSDTPVHHS